MKSVGSEEEEKIGEQKPLRASSKGLETVAGQTGWTTKTRCDYYYYYYSCDVLQSRKFRLRRDARILLVADSRVSPRVFFFFSFFSFFEHTTNVNVNTNIIIHDTREIESWGNMVEDGGTRGGDRGQRIRGEKVEITNSRN